MVVDCWSPGVVVDVGVPGGVAIGGVPGLLVVYFVRGRSLLACRGGRWWLVLG